MSHPTVWLEDYLSKKRQLAEARWHLSFADAVVRAAEEMLSTQDRKTYHLEHCIKLYRAATKKTEPKRPGNP